MIRRSKLIRNQRYFASGAPNPKHILLMCWFGGNIWQMYRMIRVLNKAQYDVTAISFSKTVLSKGNPELLPTLAEEVTELAEQLALQLDQPILLIGISIGGLMSLNVLRRSPHFKRGIFITGGDIAKATKRFYKKAWPQTYEEIAARWKDVNMYSNPETLQGKKMLFVMHPSSKLIDARDIYAEAANLEAAGVDTTLIKRHRFDHLGTIFEEAIMHPERLLEYIAQIDTPVRYKP